jgi:hypothetical protein
MRERTLLANIQNSAPEVEDGSVTFVGRYAPLDVFEYCGIFLDSVLGEDSKYSDQVRDMIDPPAAILCSQAILGSMAYGAVAISEDRAITIHAAKRVPQCWSHRDNGLWRRRVSSRFCPVPGRFGKLANLFQRRRFPERLARGSRQRHNCQRQRRNRNPRTQARREIVAYVDSTLAITIDLLSWPHWAHRKHRFHWGGRKARP